MFFKQNVVTRHITQFCLPLLYPVLLHTFTIFITDTIIRDLHSHSEASSGSWRRIRRKCSVDILYYYTSDSLWKIWLVESIPSIHNSLWTWHDECNIYRRYCIYHVKFNVCLVTKPLGVFFSETEWLNVFFCLLFKKCIIKQLLNSVFAWYHELSKLRVCIICLSRTQTSVLIIHDIMLNLIQ